MDLEVFEGCETVEEAVSAAKRARMVRFMLYVDLHANGNRRGILEGHDNKAKNKYANQINQAINGKGGFPEHMAKTVEEAVGLPFGWLDQPYPANELRASMARARRLLNRIEARDEAIRKLIGPKSMNMITGAAAGERGVSLDLYKRVLKQLKSSKRVPLTHRSSKPLHERVLEDLETRIGKKLAK